MASFVDATDLNVWANRRDAQSELPRVLRRLVFATSKRVEKLGFPAGEGVQLGGWDGTVEVKEGNTFVPDGKSVWEMGTNRDIKTKADNDYRKRTENPKNVSTASTTFVFVTPRRWGGKDDWIAEKNKDSPWTEVRAYDADDLEIWLELAPSVHAWLSRRLGKVPEHIQGLEDFWEEWQSATTPLISPELALSGRQEITDKVLEWLEHSPSNFTLRADSSEEATAILAATIQQLEHEKKDAFHAKCLIVHNETAWRQLVLSGENLILIPMFHDIRGINRAVQRGHRVFMPLGKEANASGNLLEVPRLDRDQATQAMKTMGLEEEVARSRLRESRRSMTVLRRLLATNPEVSQPKWARPGEGPNLVPVLLVGAWNETKEADRQALEEIARRPYDEILTTLTRWLNDPDPPVSKVGDIWQIVSREDSWQLLSRYISSDDLKAFERVVLSYLGSEDPRYELEPDQRWYASILGKELPHSGHLRNGLVETLALLGARASTGIDSSMTTQERASLIVYKLLNESNWIVWSSLSSYLPLLAESAPETFLDLVESHLAGEDPTVMKLFEESGSLTPSSAHTGLLWALETLAWDADLLARVSLILAKLVRLDPGGRLSNRPDKSLHEIFKLWHPQTAASPERRIKVIDTLLAREPEVAYQLLFNLLPNAHEIAHPTHKPRWRDWSDSLKLPITNKEFYFSSHAIIERIVANIGTEVKRWVAVVKRLEDFPKSARGDVIDMLNCFDDSTFNPEDQAILWNELRSVIHRHRQFSGAKWALPPDVVDKLYCVYQQLEPTDFIEQYIWLFAFSPELPEIDTRDYDERQKKISEIQNRVVKDIVQKRSWQALTELAPHVENPYALGFYAGKGEEMKRSGWNLLTATLGSDDAKLVSFGQGFIGGRFNQTGWGWVKSAVKTKTFKSWSPAQRGDFLLTFSLNRQVADLLKVQDDQTRAHYWKRVSHYRTSTEVFREATARFLQYGRPLAAVNLAARSERKEDGHTYSADELLEILEAVVHSLNDVETDNDGGMSRYHLTQVFKYLAELTDVDRGRFARLEWLFLPLFRYSEYSPRVLHDELSTDPKFFVEVLSWLYSAEDEEEREPESVTEEEIWRGKNSYELLDTWYRIPGSTDDGEIDSDRLKQWVAEARLLCQESGRGTLGDQHIGQVFAYAPADEEGIWPAVPVRDVIEKVESRELERGISIGVYNKRGITTRLPDAGGDQERDLAIKYREYAKSIADSWPRTAAVLRKIAESYEADAKRHDIDAELIDF